MIHLNEFQTFLLLSILKVLVVLVITLTAVAYTVLLERKVLGRIQNRWGPSRVGPFMPESTKSFQGPGRSNRRLSEDLPGPVPRHGGNQRSAFSFKIR